MSKPLVTGFRHVGLIVADLERSTRFYSETLGLEIIQDFEDSSEYINKITGLAQATARFVKLKMADGAILELLTYPTHKTAPHNLSIINVGVAHIALCVRSAMAAYSELVAKGISVISEPVLSSEGIALVFFCLDPDGFRVEIVEML